MNTEIDRMIWESEGRYVNADEAAVLRNWAMGLPARVALARRIEELEATLVAQTLDRFVERTPDLARLTPETRDRLSRDLATTLRHVANGVVREDVPAFRRAHAAWVAEIFRSTGENARYAAAVQCMKGTFDEAFEPADARTIQAFLDALVDELNR